MLISTFTQSSAVSRAGVGALEDFAIAGLVATIESEVTHSDAWEGVDARRNKDCDVIKCDIDVTRGVLARSVVLRKNVRSKNKLVCLCPSACRSRTWL